MKIVLALVCLSGLVGFFWGSAAGADQVFYVNQAHPQASDRNPGSQALPFKTITQAASVAVANNENQIGTKILIGAGTYRESLFMLKHGRETGAPIAFEAQGKVVISGSDVWPDWQPVAGTDIFVHYWPYAWGLAAIPEGWAPYVTLQDIVRRSEMVFVNGRALHQVLSFGALKTDSFYVDEPAQRIYIRLPGNTLIEKVAVEVANRSRLFWASGKSNIVLKGLIFQHASTALDGQAVLVEDSSHIRIELCRFQWNNWGGLGLGLSRNITVRNSVANNNGGAGIGTRKTNTLVFEGNETSYNNWRGLHGGFTDWAVAGMKNLHTHGGTFLRHKSLENATHGLWFDMDCEDIFIDQATICSNVRTGIYLEANQGPITIQNTKICKNQDYGVLIANSAKVNLQNNTIYGNAGSQIFVSGLYDLPRTVTNWETGENRTLLAEQASWKYNAFVGHEANQDLLGANLSSRLWGHFVNTSWSDQNLWFNPKLSRPFQIAGGNRISMETWQSTTGQDRQSLSADPRFKDPGNGDFRLFSDSPLLAFPGWYYFGHSYFFPVIFYSDSVITGSGGLNDPAEP